MHPIGVTCPFFKPRIRFILMLVWFGLVVFGCTAGSQQRVSDGASKWECDANADQAMQIGDYQTAIELHQRFLKDHPGNGKCLYHLGYAYGQIEQYDQEIRYYEKADVAGYDADESLFINMGLAYGRLLRIDESKKAFEKALAIKPDSVDAYFGLAQTYELNIEYVKAAKTYERALALDPENVDVLLRVSVFYADIGEFQKASEVLEKILQIDPNNEVAAKFLQNLRKE